MLEAFLRSFFFIPLELLLWLVGLTLIPRGVYFIRTKRSVSARAKPVSNGEKDRRSPHQRDKSDFEITVETGEAVRQKGFRLIAAGGACLAVTAVLFVLFLVTGAYTVGGLIGLVIGLAILAPVAWYFATPPKSPH
jgi:uncharacterized membrane protein YfcA